MAGNSLRGGRGVVSIPLADTIEKNRLELGLWSGLFVDGSRVQFTPSPVAIGMGLIDDLEVSLSVLFIDEDDPSFRPGMADPIIAGVKYRFFDEKRLRPALALRLEVVRADWTVDLHPEVVLQKSFRRFKLNITGGYYAAFDKTPSERRAVTLGVGGQAMFEEWTFAVEVTGRLDEEMSFRGGNPISYRPASVALRPMATYQLTERFSVSLIGEGAIGEHVADFRAILGVTFSSGPERRADRDDDKINDINDRCIFEKEDMDGIEDEDGCPEDDSEIEGEKKSKDKKFTTPTPRFRMKIRELKHPIEPTPQDAGSTPQKVPRSRSKKEPAP